MSPELNDQRAAIEELSREIIGDENDQGLIPVELADFVTDEVIQTSKLWPILDGVESAW